MRKATQLRSYRGPKIRRLCRHADRTLSQDLISPSRIHSGRFILYRVDRAAYAAYVLVWPNDSGLTNMVRRKDPNVSTVCWYDDKWKQRGLCVGV